jgi:hypothetical protein
MSQDGQGMGGMPGMESNGMVSLQQDGSMGGDGSNNQGGGNSIGGGVDANTLLAQQQALMAMTGGAGIDAGASRDALMSLLAKQGFGAAGGQGMPQMGMMGGMGAMNGMQLGAINAMGQIGAMAGMSGLQQTNQGINQLDNSNNNNGTDNSNVNQNIMANPAFSGFSPTMGGFQGGFPIGMGE